MNKFLYWLNNNAFTRWAVAHPRTLGVFDAVLVLVLLQMGTVIAYLCALVIVAGNAHKFYILFKTPRAGENDE